MLLPASSCTDIIAFKWRIDFIGIETIQSRFIQTLEALIQTGIWPSSDCPFPFSVFHLSVLDCHCFFFFFYCLSPQDSVPSQSRDHAGNCSLFVNEAAFASASINNRHIHHKRNDPSAHNCLNTLLARSNSRQAPIAKTPHSPLSDPQGWMMGTGYLYNPAGKLELQHTASGKNDLQVGDD